MSVERVAEKEATRAAIKAAEDASVKAGARQQLAATGRAQVEQELLAERKRTAAVATKLATAEAQVKTLKRPLEQAVQRAREEERDRLGLEASKRTQRLREELNLLKGQLQSAESAATVAVAAAAAAAAKCTAEIVAAKALLASELQGANTRAGFYKAKVEQLQQAATNAANVAAGGPLVAGSKRQLERRIQVRDGHIDDRDAKIEALEAQIVVLVAAAVEKGGRGKHETHPEAPPPTPFPCFPLLPKLVLSLLHLLLNTCSLHAHYSCSLLAHYLLITAAPGTWPSLAKAEGRRALPARGARAPPPSRQRVQSAAA